MCSLISLNTQGLRSCDRRHTAFTFFKRHKYDFIFLQETHWTSELQDSILRDWAGDIFFNHGNASALGVAIFFNPHLDYTLIDRQHDSTGRILSILIKLVDQLLRLTNIYAPNTDAERRIFYVDLENYLSSSHNNILGGDFNCIIDSKLDKHGGNPAPRQHANHILHRLTSRLDLVDIWRERNPHKRTTLGQAGIHVTIILPSALASTAFILPNHSTLMSMQLPLSPTRTPITT